MKRAKTDRMLLAISVFGFFLMSISFLFMPQEGVDILPGVLFWGGLGIGTVLQIVLETRRRAFFASYGVKREKMQKPRNGLLTFGSNRAAVAADNVMVISAVVMIVTLILTKATGMIPYIMISVTLLAFCLHCILNGRICFHVKNQMKLRQMLEHKKVNSQGKGEGEYENRKFSR